MSGDRPASIGRLGDLWHGDTGWPTREGGVCPCMCACVYIHTVHVMCVCVSESMYMYVCDLLVGKFTNFLLCHTYLELIKRAITA